MLTIVGEHYMHRERIAVVTEGGAGLIRIQYLDEPDSMPFYVRTKELKKIKVRVTAAERVEARKVDIIAHGSIVYPEKYAEFEAAIGWEPKKDVYDGAFSEEEKLILPVLLSAECYCSTVLGDERGALRMAEIFNMTVQEAKDYARVGGERTTDSRDITINIVFPYPLVGETALNIWKWAEKFGIFPNPRGKYVVIQLGNLPLVKHLASNFGLRPMLKNEGQLGVR